MDFIKDVVKELNNDYAKVATDIRDRQEFVDTSSLLFNALCSGDLFGGISKNSITAIAGSESTGKTFFSLGIAKNFLDENPTGYVMYIESESAINRKLLESKSIPLDRFVVVPVATIEEFRTTALRALDRYIKVPVEDRVPFMMVLDSLGMLSTSKEVNDTLEGKDVRDMTKSALIKGAFRVLTLKLGEADVPLIVTNHTYDKIGSYVPEKEMGGGGGLKYAASQIIYLSKKKEKDGTEIVGNIIKAKVVKSRLSKENQTAEIRLFYDNRGIDKYYGILELGIEAGLITQGGAWYTFVDTGEKVQKKKILENVDEYFNEEFLTKLNTYVKEKFSYGF
jgi:RecA/RadA recombinase